MKINVDLKKITFIYNHLNIKHKIIVLLLKKVRKISKEMQRNYRNIFFSTYLKGKFKWPFEISRCFISTFNNVHVQVLYNIRHVGS